MLTFKFGNSIRPPNTPIVEKIAEALPNTLLLMGLSTVLSIIIGILTGIIAAYKRGGKLDTTLVISSLITYSLPTFWMGMIALIVFSRTLGWFPPGQTISNLYPPMIQTTIGIPNLFAFALRIPSIMEIGDRLWHLFLPCAVLTLFQYGNYLLLTRATMLETLTEDYIVTARAKGLKERTVIFKHAFKNASLPIITSVALAAGFMISGAIITETVFSWPGLGRLTMDAINLYDYPFLHVIFYVVALCVILANFIADLLYGVIDPRIKYG
jgi:peptide/nickel transport system permease protein